MAITAFSARPSGLLVAWGGGSDGRLLDWLVARGVTTAEIVVAATPVRPLVTGRSYAAALRARGVPEAKVLHITARHPADAPTHLRRLAQADLVFFTGGDQERLTAALAGTEFLTQLRARYHHGGLTVAGTSAGATALADRMVVAGHGWRALLSGRVRLAPGLGLLPGVFLDTHFTERGRFGRLAHAVLLEPTTLGIGLAEETGIVWPAGGVTEGGAARAFQVIGDEVVSVLDGRQSAAPNLATRLPDTPISGRGVQLHLLADSETFQW